MKLGVTGSRKWKGYREIWEALDAVRPRPTLIIHGGAEGVDSMADAWAKMNDIPRRVIRPDYKRFPPNVAPLERNTDIVTESDRVLAFRWRGISNGTDDCTKKASAAGKLERVVHGG